MSLKYWKESKAIYPEAREPLIASQSCGLQSRRNGGNLSGMMTRAEQEHIAVETLVNHEPTREQDGAFRAVETATGLDTIQTKQLIEDLRRSGRVYPEGIPTREFSSDAQRWCWKRGPG